MTEHDRVRQQRALNCDRNDLESVADAIRGLQSTDDPSLMPLHDELSDQYSQLKKRSAYKVLVDYVNGGGRLPATAEEIGIDKETANELRKLSLPDKMAGLPKELRSRNFDEIFEAESDSPDSVLTPGLRFLCIFEELPQQAQEAIFGHIYEALRWRGWDRVGGLHAGRAKSAIAEIAKIFTDNGHEIAELT